MRGWCFAEGMPISFDIGTYSLIRESKNWERHILSSFLIKQFFTSLFFLCFSFFIYKDYEIIKSIVTIILENMRFLEQDGKVGRFGIAEKVKFFGKVLNELDQILQEI